MKLRHKSGAIFLVVMAGFSTPTFANDSVEIENCNNVHVPEAEALDCQTLVNGMLVALRKNRARVDMGRRDHMIGNLKESNIADRTYRSFLKYAFTREQKTLQNLLPQGHVLPADDSKGATSMAMSLLNHPSIDEEKYIRDFFTDTANSSVQTMYRTPAVGTVVATR